MDNKVTKQKNNDLLDLVKFIMSFLIVAIHTKLFGEYLYPWLRLAVPIFFMISSYLFFCKINSCETNREKFQALKKFVIRNMILYAFWFVVLLPFNNILRGWFDGGFFKGILNIALNVVIGSTFVASWFISALILGTIIVFFASKKVNIKVLFGITLVIQILVAIRSSHMYPFTDVSSLQGVLSAVGKYERIMNSPVLSFPAGLFWIVSGKMFADGKFKLAKKPTIIILAVSLPLLLTEWIIAKINSGVYNSDVFIFLIPCVLMIFNLLMMAKPVKVKYSREMRKMSTIIYASHGTAAICVEKLYELIFGTSFSIIVFLTVCAICIGGSLLILKLEKYKYLKWLKYSH